MRTSQRRWEGCGCTLAAHSLWMQATATHCCWKKEEWHKQKNRGDATRAKRRSLCTSDPLQTALFGFGLHLDQIRVFKHKPESIQHNFQQLKIEPGLTFPTHVIPEDAEQGKGRLPTTATSARLSSELVPLAFVVTGAPNMSFGCKSYTFTDIQRR